ncbi:MAG TPA: ASKHA domain-containing protein [Desulfomicrobiaceae bacterium]|nr:ASKHA domain-containing protein [Desulfomicrobiaceae bacterium]
MSGVQGAMTKNCTVIIGKERKTLFFSSRVVTLAQLLFLSGIFQGAPLCSGAGLCGHCRVRFEKRAPDPSGADLEVFSREEVEGGWRLACRHAPISGSLVRVLQANTPSSFMPAPGRAGRRTVAVDIGTTIIKWAECRNGSVGPTRSVPNPQMGAGSEIMARLAFEAQVKPGMLGELARSFVRGLDLHTEDSLVVTGNTVMIALLLGLPVHGLARAPYSLPWAGGQREMIAPDLPCAYIPPLLAPFLGADVSAGLACVVQGMEPVPTYPFLYADLGTNGEFVLARDEETFFMASVPMGPALEGVGLRFGAPAGSGVITSFDLSPLGLEPDGDLSSSFQAISGTGYLSLLGALKRIGIMDDFGRFASPCTPLAAKIYGSPEGGLGDRIPLPGGMFLDGKDVEEVLKVKAAWNQAVSVLSAESGVAPGRLTAIYLAGTFGRHVSGEDLEELGFLPTGGRRGIRCVDDAPLRGGCLLLENPEAGEWCESLRTRTRLVDLSAARGSGRDLVERMRFSFVP